MGSSSYLGGRGKGAEIRKKLNLDKIDKSDEKVEFFVTSKIVGISRILIEELFLKSVKRLKEKKFREKYTFKYENKDVESLVKRDVERGIIDILDAPNFWDILFSRVDIKGNR